MAGRPRDEDHGDQRDGNAEDGGRGRQALGREPDDDGDDGADHTRRRGDDAHPADREAAVERGDADDPGNAGRHRPQEVRALRHRLVAGDRHRQRRDHPHDLRQRDHAEQRRPAAQDATPEVAGPPGDRGCEAEQDDGEAGANLRQAAPLRAPRPASTAVGPASCTTLSARWS